MNETKDGGPAFPIVDPHQLEPRNVGEMKRLAHGMSLRDHFATHCPAAEVVTRMPTKLGDLADAYVKHGWLDAEVRRSTPVINIRILESETLRHRLRAIIRYEYADDMLEARKQ